MSVVSDLKAAKAIISDPKNWIKGNMAKASKRGERVKVVSDRAKCFCAYGAVERITVDGAALSGVKERLATHYLNKAIPDRYRKTHARPVFNITNYNDRKATRHADVVSWFDKAITMAEQDAAR